MKLQRQEAQSLLSAMEGRKVLVLGDLMLDEYLFGEVHRISPEAPVPIVRILREKAVLGGAANVAANVKALGGVPVLLGASRRDPAGLQLRVLLEGRGIGLEGLIEDPQWPTIVKTRVIGQQQQMLRIDREEEAPASEQATDLLLEGLSRLMECVEAVILSDYAKGVVTPELAAALRKACRDRNLPWIVDPKPVHRSLYVGATAMTPNTKEASELSGLPARTDEDVRLMGPRLVEELQMKGMLLTRSEKGMTLFAPSAEHPEPWFIPTEAQEVFDVSGAGDTVIGCFSLALATGSDWKQAAMLANAAAGLVVAKFGTATVTPREILDHFHEQEAR